MRVQANADCLCGLQYLESNKIVGYHMRNVLRVLLLSGMCLILLSGCSLYESILSTDQRADLNQIYDLSEGEAVVVADNEKLEAPALIREGVYYFSMKQVRSALDKRFYWDGADEDLFFTDAKSIYKESVSDRSMALLEDDELYLSAECLQKYLGVQIAFYEEPYRVYLDSAGAEIRKVCVNKDTVVRLRGGYKSEILTDIESGDLVQLIEEYDRWAKVRTDDGLIGYALLKYLDMDQIEATILDQKEEPEYTNIQRDYTICLAWHDMENVSGNGQFDELVKDTKGINVISPTWFALQSNDGNYRNLSSAEYVRKAHEQGMEVWILIDDFAKNMSIGQVLGKNSVRQALVENLIRDTKAVNADGINIDFEYITDSCGVDFIQFLRELSIRCREEGLVLSVDNANPTFIKYCYDMEEQGRLADYVILMGYDEHWQGSEAGSVSSLSYVREGIQAALNMVPEEKVISGLPFYTRVWTEIPEEYAASGAEIREDGNSEYDRYSLDSVALSMDEVEKLVEKSGVTPEWDKTTGQYYLEIPLEHGKQRIWMEDLNSMEAKLGIVAEYDLAGVAFWRIGMDSSEVWNLVVNYCKSEDAARQK